jgi:hypothetical protein
MLLITIHTMSAAKHAYSVLPYVGDRYFTQLSSSWELCVNSVMHSCTESCSTLNGEPLLTEQPYNVHN